MKKPWVMVLVVLIGLSIVGFWFINAQNIRKTVLSQLEEKLEFCSIVNDNINAFSNTGNFWMMCNNRPFYAEYKNGNVSYELNGWEFLKKDPLLWSELSNCNFYDSKNSQLIFFCPWDFNVVNIISKIYQFNIKSFKLEKIKEGDFLDVLGDDIKEMYNFLSECSISNFTSYRYEGYAPVLSLTLSCEDEDYLIATDFQMIPIQPPISMNSELSNEERAKISFEKSFAFNIDDITSIGNSVTINSDNNLFTYSFGDFPTLQYRLECPESERCLREFGKFFILPLIDYTNIEFIKERTTIPLALLYRIDDSNIVSIGKIGENIISFGIKKGFMYEKYR